MTTNGTTAGAMPEIAEHEPAIASSKAKRLYLILGGAVLLLLIGYGIYAFLAAGKATTDDAQVAGAIVPVAARVAGQVTAIYINENQPVHAGQPIADLDPSDAQVKVAQAEGDLATAQAQAADADARTAVTSASARGALTSRKARCRARAKASTVPPDRSRKRMRWSRVRPQTRRRRGSTFSAPRSSEAKAISRRRKWMRHAPRTKPPMPISPRHERA